MSAPAFDDARLREAVAGAVTSDTRIEADDIRRVTDAFGLDGPDSVLLAAVPVAAALADPAVSGYRVGAVGLERETGDLLLAGNLEFPGADLGRTIHAEGAIGVRAFLRGTSITTLAIDSARPCAFCRQSLSEFAWTPTLRLIDPLGHERTMAELYPWPFVPADLGMQAAGPGPDAWPELESADDRLPADVADALVSAGRSAHAPYSRCPAAVVLRLRDGTRVAGRTLESVAFDPTFGPLQVALVALRAGGHGYADIASAWLASRSGGPVDDVGPTRHLLAAVAPDVILTTTTWH